jgi:hypothetical protein
VENTMVYVVLDPELHPWSGWICGAYSTMGQSLELWCFYHPNQ